MNTRRKRHPAPAQSQPHFIHPYERLAPWPQAILAAGMSIVIGLALAWLSNHSSIAEVVKRMTARLYLPALSSAYPTTGRDAITVLTIDDGDLQKRQLSWPLPLDQYKALIERLLRYEPRAIFLDLVFLDQRPEDQVQGLARAACRAREQGVPVYLASLQGQIDRESDTEQRLLGARTTDGRPCFSPVAPNISVDRYDRSSWEYPLHVERSPLRSAALAIACDTQPEACPRDTKEELAIVWGSRPDPMNEQLMLAADEMTGELEPVCRSDWSWLELVPKLGGLLRELPTPDWLIDRLPDNDWWAKQMSFRRWSLPLCVYNRSLPLRALDGGPAISLDELRASLHQRVVLIGTDFQSRGDHVMAPLQGRVPGVHAHAMALDNLLSYRGDYRLAGDFAPQWPLTRPTVYTLIAVVLLAVGMVGWGRFTRVWARRAALPSRRAGLGASNAEPARKHGRKGPARLLSFLRHFVAKLLTLGLYAAAPPRHGAAYRYGRPLLAALLSVLGILLLFQLGDRLMHVGPLSLIEFLLFPLGVEFMHGGEKAARLVAAVWEATGRQDPHAYLVWAARQEEDGGSSH